MNPSPTPSANYAGIGTQFFSYPTRQPAQPSHLAHPQTVRGPMAHQGFFDLLSLAPPQLDGRSEGDERWDWEYDENGNQVMSEGTDGFVAGKRYEDLPSPLEQPVLRPTFSSPKKKRESSEAAQMLRQLQGGEREIVLNQAPVVGSMMMASVKGLKQFVLDPAVGALSSIWNPSPQAQAQTQTQAQPQPPSPPSKSVSRIDGIPQKIKRKPVLPLDPALPSSPPNPIRTVKILTKPPQGKEDWKPRGQLGSILLGTQRVKRPPQAAVGQGGKIRMNGVAIPGQTQGGTGGGLDKRLISWPMDFRHLAHAESEEEAMFMLMRWGMDGMGKIADPIWADAIKALVKQRAADQQARAIAQSMIARERGLVGGTPFQTLRVINGMPSSAYSQTTISTARPSNPSAGQLRSTSLQISTPGIPFSTPGLATPTRYSPSRGSPSKGKHGNSSGNPFESAFAAPSQEERDIMAYDREIVIKPTLPLRIKGRKGAVGNGTKLQDLVQEEAEGKRLPQVVGPEDIDGLPFPSVTRATEASGNSPTIRAANVNSATLDREFETDLHDVFESMPSRVVLPSLPTLEKAMSVAIYFETLYHALLKPPKSIEAAHPNNYILNRRRRELALEQEMENRGCTEEERQRLRDTWREEETKGLREKRKKVGTLSFAKLKVIGHGAFGVVNLVREKDTGKLFAMKELRKADMLRKGQEGHVRAEKDLLAAAANSGAGAQWIVKLHYSFQDVDKLYLVLTYEGGGDLLNLLVERDTFDEDFTRFYVAEMILAIEATHKLGFIHRDIKPDNFLFSKEGHLRISDFGLANDLHWAHDTYYYDQQRRALLKKHGIDLEEPSKMKVKTMKRREVEAIMGRAWLNQGQGMLTWRDGKRRKLAMSVCGTNSYMAPEVIRGMGYGFTCDWWSLGCIAFECLYGFPPFVSSTRHQTRQKILSWRETLRFPTKPRLSRQCTDFLANLLCEPEDRLGSMATASTNRPNSIMTAERSNPWNNSNLGGTRNGPRSGLGDDGAAEIKAHPWFRTIDWKNIHLESAPYQPDLISDSDTRHFDDDIPDEPLAPPGGAPANATKDPMLADRKHGAHLLDIRKQMAFAGWTYKANKQDIEDMRIRAMQGIHEPPRAEIEEEFPIRSTGTIGRTRALSF